ELSGQRRELRSVPRTGGNDDEPVDLIDDEVLVRSVREQAGGLRIRFRHQPRQMPLRIVDHPSAHLLGDLAVLIERRTDHPTAVELHDLLYPEYSVQTRG